MTRPVRLETSAREFAEATAKPPFPADLGPAKTRALLDQVQSSPVAKPDAAIEDLAIPGGPRGEIAARIVKPRDASGTLPVVLYTHGGGWAAGGTLTHDRLVREIATSAGAAVVFPSYRLSPESRYPGALEETYATLEWIAGSGGGAHGLDGKRIAVAGDSAGGNLAASVAILAKRRRGPAIAAQLLYYPVTDAAFDTASYLEFATGFFLRRDSMQWFWDQYAPDRAKRAEATCSPLRASIDDLRGLPPALVVVAEADVLRDEGEAYANQLREAGVAAAAARFQGTIHDFVMLNALAASPPTRAAMALSTTWLREVFRR